MITNALVFSRAKLADYLELTKPRLVSLVILSAFVGFFLGSKGPLDAFLLLTSLLGTGLVAGGSMCLNQWMERGEDARMNRTASRPLPSGRIQPAEAFFFGTALSLAGTFLLYFAVNLSAAVLAVLTTLSYLLLYTPLKRKTSLCTIVGAVPGALPPLIGWAAAQGRTSYESWLLFAVLFLWQMPHFLAIAWIYRKEYAAAGFQMLSVIDPSGAQVGRQIALYSLALLPVSLLPTAAGITGSLYFFGALGLGIFFVTQGVLSLKNLDAKARSLFRNSILYLTLLLVLMVLDKG